MEYTVEKDTLAIVFPEQGLWTKDRARVHKTRFTNTFSESEVVIHPNRTPDELPSDESVVRAAYGVMGYFGFQRSGETMVLLVPCEDVWILTDKGFTKEEIKNGKDHTNREEEVRGDHQEQVLNPLPRCEAGDAGSQGATDPFRQTRMGDL